ncbi:putative penicillin-binding protein [Bacillus sp. TS-2]|nr:putative penicillin-binding protein [Bacillus sp. TS-2]
MNLLKKDMMKLQKEVQFSGSLLVQKEDEDWMRESYGFANRSEQLNNHNFTKYGIASGCKLFTAIAICQLVQENKLSFTSSLKDCLNVSFPNFPENITVHHLLTHTSGIPDYFDEELMDDFEELWKTYPMYQIRELKDFLPLFQNNKMKSKVGERFHYNNAGYILLGLIVEEASGFVFSEYIEQCIFKVAGCKDSGYFEFDRLPPHIALGYIDTPDGGWKTNIYSLPVKGGSDGGAFVTVDDMSKIWRALLNHQLLKEEFTNKLLNPYIGTGKENSYYGYGTWINTKNSEVHKYHIMGYDPGVSFHSAYYPKESILSTVCSNQSSGAFVMMKEIEKHIESFAKGN